MRSTESLKGRRFGRWRVLSKEVSVSKNSKWMCRCDCGTKKIVLRCSLIQGDSKSCGCFQSECTSKRRTSNFIGKQFGFLVVKQRNGSYCRQARWLCQCDCGNTKNVVTNHLTCGYVSSCGCYRKIVMRELHQTKEFRRNYLVGVREANCGRSNVERMRVKSSQI